MARHGDPDDLDELYKAVMRGFTDTTISSNVVDSPASDIINEYADSPNTGPVTMPVPEPAAPLPVPSKSTPRSHRASGRPLPRVPSATSSIGGLPGVEGTPGDRSSVDTLRGGRRLPTMPETNGDPSHVAPYPGPPPPLPTRQSRPDMVQSHSQRSNGSVSMTPSSSYYATPRSQYNALPTPHVESDAYSSPPWESRTLNGNGAGDLHRRPSQVSQRPPGALAPAMPGLGLYSVDNPPPPPPPLPSQTHSVDPTPRSSYDEADYLSRSQSVGSFSNSEQHSLSREASARSNAYTHETGITSPMEAGPSNMERVDSMGSIVSNDETRNQIVDPYALSHPSITVSGAPHQREHSPPHSTPFQQHMESKRALQLMDDFDDGRYSDEEYEEDMFFNLALLSHMAVRLRDKVPRGTHVKGSIPYPHAFTGKDIVSTIQAQIQRDSALNVGISRNDRRAALQVARSLQSQLFFFEVEWGDNVLTDGVEDVYMFLEDLEGGAGSAPVRGELPTGVVTVLTQCYTPSCADGSPCYAYSCPRKAQTLTRSQSIVSVVDRPTQSQPGDWRSLVGEEVARRLPEREVRRQTIIHQVILKEQQYVQDLDTIENLFIKPLRRNNPPIIHPSAVEEFIETVFGNIMDIRECNRRLLDNMYIRQREQRPILHGIGDIFLTAATSDFRREYPIYVGHHGASEKRLKEEMEQNGEFRRFVEQCARQPDARRLDLKHFLNRPSEHLQRYPALLDAISKDTEEGHADVEFLHEAAQAIRRLSTVAHLMTWQTAMGRGPTAKQDWADLVAKDVLSTIPKQEAKRQGRIFELIKGEMEYVKDLETIETLFVQPLQNANPPIIAPDRLTSFLDDVFHNFMELHTHHRRMLDTLHEIQREEHPLIRSITEPLFDAALNWRDAYMEYVPHYPIAEYRIGDEMANNLAFKTFVQSCARHPDARRLDMKTFVNRPIPRLLRYNLLLKEIMEESPIGHSDRDTIPQVLDVIKDLGKATEPGVATANEKVELWRYNANLVFRPSEAVDMDLLSETRALIHTGKFMRQPDTGFEWSGWTELFALLFDNYLVMTKTKEKDGVTKYHVNRAPIPLELLTLANFTDPPQQRTGGFMRGFRGDRHGPDPSASNLGANGDANPNESRLMYPITLHHNGRQGGLYTVYAESASARTEWKTKLEEAIHLRSVVQESNKVFELETLSTDTFLVPSIGAAVPAWNDENTFTGKVTCSVPFSTTDGRGLVAIGCAEGVWIGLRHDSRSLRRVLHLKHVTQCAMLEDFGIFLVLADKSLFAYHIEALVPSNPPSPNATRTPQKLNGSREVQFFSVGTLNGRTLIIYMKKKGVDSVFRVLEPVVGKIAEKSKNAGAFGRYFNTNRSELFRVYKDFFLPSEAYDLVFLKAKIAILCTKGFEIMDLTDFRSVTIPQRDDPRLAQLAKRCESCKPMGMFRASDNEFLLCYDEFGLFVDRHGDPSRSTGTIEWEGTAERVACHPPYILVFDSRFVEVRHMDTGRLAQIISGSDVRCIWDGRGNSMPAVSTPGPDGWQDGVAQEPRVHAVMRSSEPVGPGANSRRAVAQQVFELVPTIPLYLPGSLSSPNASTYFPPQPPASPPDSPQWR